MKIKLAQGLFDRNLGVTTGLRLCNIHTTGSVVIDRETENFRNMNPEFFEGHSMLLGSKYYYGAELVYSAPPCSPYSKLQHTTSAIPHVQEGWQAQKMEQFEETLRYYQRHLPKIILMENVVGKIEETYKWFVDNPAFETYSFYRIILDLLRTGFPQRRIRGFIVGIRDGAALGLFENLSSSLLGSRPNPYPTISELLEKPPYLTPDPSAMKISYDPREGHKRILPYTPNNAKLRDTYYYLRGVPKDTESGPGLGHWRLDWNSPAPTLHGGIRLYHPDFNRGLFDREVGVLMGFPEHLNFEWEAYTPYFLGKGVSPPFITSIVSALQKSDFGGNVILREKADFTLDKSWSRRLNSRHSYNPSYRGIWKNIRWTPWPEIPWPSPEGIIHD